MNGSQSTFAPEASELRQVPAPAAPYPARGLSDPRRKSPVLAGLLSLMPGLGQVYVGYYVRGFVHAIVVGALISILASEAGEQGAIPIVALFMVFFWLYNVIDAARKAALVNLALEGIGTVELPEDFKAPGFQGSIASGILLVTAGAILLSNTLFGASLAWLGEWWPAAPILLGVYLLVRGILDRR